MTRLHTRSGVARRLRRLARHPATRVVLALVAVVVGLALVALAGAVGHCEFAGGRCPAEPVPWWQDDVLGTAAVGLAIAVATPVVAWRPDRRGLGIAVAVVVATLPVAWLVAEGARTGGL